MPVSDHKSKGSFLCLIVVNLFSVLPGEKLHTEKVTCIRVPPIIRDMYEITGKSQILMRVFQSE